MKTGILANLSVQQLVDCSKNGVDSGCEGGDLYPAFQYVL